MVVLSLPRRSYEVEIYYSAKINWQTIAWYNSPEYINAAFAAGINHPVGMTLQDAGWKGGPFLGKATIKSSIRRMKYTTWRNYFQHVTAADKKPPIGSLARKMCW
jgi:alpha-mannosidase